MKHESQKPIHEGKLRCAIMLVDSIKRLNSPFFPIESAIADQFGSVNAEIERQEFSCAWTQLVLSALTVELVIKHAWEEENSGRQALYTHNVLDICDKLSDDVKCYLKRIYADCVLPYIKATEIGPNQDIAIASPASFEEALKWNESAVKDLKYKIALPGKFVPYGVFWNSETIWIPSSDVNLPNYAIELVCWATAFYGRVA